MKCLLMHKRIPVADIELDDDTGFVRRLGEVYAPEHISIGIPIKNKTADRAHSIRGGQTELSRQAEAE